LIADSDRDNLLQIPSEKPTGYRGEPMDDSDRPTIIEKYADRRLYHTGTYSLVTLDELAARVKRGRDFIVYDAMTGADITPSVLAQIVFQAENSHGAR
jgi:polyhydroxyalkanoate synthesis regulator protein